MIKIIMVKLPKISNLALSEIEFFNKWSTKNNTVAIAYMKLLKIWIALSRKLFIGRKMTRNIRKKSEKNIIEINYPNGLSTNRIRINGKIMSLRVIRGKIKHPNVEFGFNSSNKFFSKSSSDFSVFRDSFGRNCFTSLNSLFSIFEVSSDLICDFLES